MHANMQNRRQRLFIHRRRSLMPTNRNYSALKHPLSPQKIHFISRSKIILDLENENNSSPLFGAFPKRNSSPSFVHSFFSPSPLTDEQYPKPIPKESLKEKQIKNLLSRNKSFILKRQASDFKDKDFLNKIRGNSLTPRKMSSQFNDFPILNVSRNEKNKIESLSPKREENSQSDNQKYFNVKPAQLYNKPIKGFKRNLLKFM
ncbi:unnamed protein product [Blepharisma stoltei]|uniref:Uncharacterized protein n=1 Tax=Blepharisma stoltei TaxID=1481888 RepID=A0AAU9JAV5_9CILI|nr:unnamed protein product [Blepharisma stoltei]